MRKLFMGDKLIGFLGCDKYEIILYLSRILYHLGKKVLLVDYSESEALFQSISRPDVLKEEKEYINYGGIDFIQGKYYKKNREEIYDYILIDFGFHAEISLLTQCEKIMYVTDLQLHNVKRMKSISYHGNADKYLIIKDVFPCKIKPVYIIEQLSNLLIEEQHVYVLYQDSIDIKYRIQSQYDLKFSFPKLSKPTKFFLQDLILNISDNLSRKQLRIAYRKAERGK